MDTLVCFVMVKYKNYGLEGDWLYKKKIGYVRLNLTINT